MSSGKIIAEVVDAVMASVFVSRGREIPVQRLLFSYHQSTSAYMVFRDEGGGRFTIRVSDHKKSRPRTRAGQPCQSHQTQTFNIKEIDPADGERFIVRIVSCIRGKFEMRDRLRCAT